MGVNARIKILEVKNFQEVENKVNDFLAFNQEIEHVARINYQLEYNVVIVEYVVFNEREKEEEREILRAVVAEEYYRDNNNNNLLLAPPTTNPFTYWLRFFFPTL